MPEIKAILPNLKANLKQSSSLGFLLAITVLEFLLFHTIIVLVAALQIKEGYGHKQNK